MAKSFLDELLKELKKEHQFIRTYNLHVEELTRNMVQYKNRKNFKHESPVWSSGI